MLVSWVYQRVQCASELTSLTADIASSNSFVVSYTRPSWNRHCASFVFSPMSRKSSLACEQRVRGVYGESRALRKRGSPRGTT